MMKMKKMNNKVGWLSPLGDLIKCNRYNHISMARELVQKFKYINVLNIPDDDVLLNNGWVHISISSFGKPEWYIAWDNYLTQQQKDYLKSYYEDEEVPMCLGSKWKYESELGE